jgi:hypothetical protein
MGMLFPPAVATLVPPKITLAWDPSNEEDVAGYGLYLSKGAPGPPYEWIDDVYLDELANQNRPSFTATDLVDDGTYYFAVTAFTVEGIESDFSGALCVQKSGSSASACSSAGSGGGGEGCFVVSAAH